MKKRLPVKINCLSHVQSMGVHHQYLWIQVKTALKLVWLPRRRWSRGHFFARLIYKVYQRPGVNNLGRVQYTGPWSDRPISWKSAFESLNRRLHFLLHTLFFKIFNISNRGCWGCFIKFRFEWGFYALSASKAIFRARTYNCITYSVRWWWLLDEWN